MKRKSILLSLFVLAMIFVYVGCTKSNVTNGERRIVGTWVLQLSEYTDSTYSVLDRDYETNDCDYQSYVTTNYSLSKSSFDGSTLTSVVHEEQNTTTGSETETYEFDTTYTYTYSKEITFYEDGTCIIKTALTNRVSGTVDNSEETGRWDWVDANLEKVGIIITGDFSESNTVMYIKTLDRNELVISYVTTYSSDYNYNTTIENSCWSGTGFTDLTYLTNTSNDKSQKGTQTYSKLKE